MTVRVRLFARARDLAGVDCVAAELPAGATVMTLRRELAEVVPALIGLLERCAIAVNGEFAGEAQPLPPGAEVALLPPVSGGQEGSCP
jgi:molybdopterin converting factor subunit 1